jgi:hypothetical protein
MNGTGLNGLNAGRVCPALITNSFCSPPATHKIVLGHGRKTLTSVLHSCQSLYISCQTGWIRVSSGPCVRSRLPLMSKIFVAPMGSPSQGFGSSTALRFFCGVKRWRHGSMKQSGSIYLQSMYYRHTLPRTSGVPEICEIGGMWCM